MKTMFKIWSEMIVSKQQVEPNVHLGDNFENAPLTVVPSGKWYWDFQVQQRFPVTLDPPLGYFWNYLHQFWSPHNLSQNNQSFREALKKKV